MKKIAWEKWVDFDPEVNDPENEDDENGFDVVPLMVRTPLGAYSPYEQMTPTKLFDCWIGHTNFSLTEGDKIRLDMVDGIEVLRIMSRYRFFIGIGKLFDLKSVRPQVEIALGIQRDSLISQIISEISGKAKWAVAIYEDASHRSISSDHDDESYALRLKELRDSNPANIVTSDEFT